MDSLETESVRQRNGVDLLADMLMGGLFDAGSRNASVFAVATVARPWGRYQAPPISGEIGYQKSATACPTGSL